MKRQIRRGVFETNSSSMHSLVVTKEDDRYSKEEIRKDFYLFDDNTTGHKDCVWVIRSDELEFGRYPFQMLATFQDKWLYACASMVREYKDDIYNELEAIALKCVEGLEKIKMPAQTRCIPNKEDARYSDDEYYKEYGKTEDELAEYLMGKEEEWGIDIEYWEGKHHASWCFRVPYTGHVDEDKLSDFLKEENITIEDFLLNKKYIIVQDGDEYYYWPKIKSTGLINTDMIDHEYL